MDFHQDNKDLHKNNEALQEDIKVLQKENELFQKKLLALNISNLVIDMAKKGVFARRRHQFDPLTPTARSIGFRQDSEGRRRSL